MTTTPSTGGALRSLSTRNGRLTAIASTAAINLGFMPLFLKPAVVGDFVQQRGLSASQSGTIVTMEFLTISLMLLFASRWRGRVAYLPTALIGVALAAVAAIGCLYVNSFLGLIGLRVLSAVGTALLIFVPNLAFAGFDKPDVMFSRVYALNLVFGSIALMLVPYTTLISGGPAPFVAYLVIAAVMLPLILMMPSREASPPKVQSDNTTTEDYKSRQILWLAAGTAAFALALGQVWGFFFVLGKSAGLTMDQLSNASSLTLVGGVIGSLLGGAASRSSLSLPIFRLTIVGATIGMLLVVFAPQPILFVVGGIIGMSAIYFMFPTILGSAAEYDQSGRGIVLINGAQSLMSGTGPMVAGFIMDTTSVSGLSFSIVLCTLASLLLFEMVWRDGRRSKRVNVPVGV